MSSYDNPWTYQGRVIDDAEVVGFVGFVYIITNTLTNKAYIGKKTLVTKKTKQVSGKKKKVTVSSNWKNYYGSNATLLNDIASDGKHNYRREILHFCKNKGTANYLEAKEIFVRNVLETEGWYNEWCLCKISKTHIKLNM
jgi:hypothetical protein